MVLTAWMWLLLGTSSGAIHIDCTTARGLYAEDNFRCREGCRISSCQASDSELSLRTCVQNSSLTGCVFEVTEHMNLDFEYCEETSSHWAQIQPMNDPLLNCTLEAKVVSSDCRDVAYMTVMSGLQSHPCHHPEGLLERSSKRASFSPDRRYLSPPHYWDPPPQPPGPALFDPQETRHQPFLRSQATVTTTSTPVTTLEGLAPSYSSSSPSPLEIVSPSTELFTTTTTVALSTVPLPDGVQTVYEGDSIWISMVTVCPQVAAKLQVVSSQLFTLADLASPAISLEIAAVVAAVLVTATQM
eukprot:Protomagalhaensia_sp_Gyna_25__652@NODE_1304_length_1959_cov_117_350000_g1040_i0_p1_GENE_NODE_1304_length_1959_cov_117_350000_g1040_i0NODE_1304_length_1959_cov_117_350000_g1040_i0_p1_ORF_typecomplete_len300_score17_81UBA_e1_thiolCys/PF10585_9/0_29_NODE_1304_length_1959_cov_117_350000_g1040_i01900